MSRRRRSLRLIQGLALGGKYGGAATYVAEHAPRGRRGYATSWIQITATLGFFMSLAVIMICRTQMDPKEFADWGWRIPFLVSLILLVFSVYIRLKLNEAPLFQRMKAEGKARSRRSPTASCATRIIASSFWRCSAPRQARAWFGTRDSSMPCSSSSSRSSSTSCRPIR